jgi:hypothetical protein
VKKFKKAIQAQSKNLKHLTLTGAVNDMAFEELRKSDCSLQSFSMSSNLGETHVQISTDTLTKFINKSKDSLKRFCFCIGPQQLKNDLAKVAVLTFISNPLQHTKRNVNFTLVHFFFSLPKITKSKRSLCKAWKSVEN